MELSYTYAPEYKAIIEDYLTGLDRLAMFKKWNTERSHVMKEMTEWHKQLAAKFETFRVAKINDYSQRMTVIERRHKNTRNIYTDPQAEILRRQDFDLELENWSKIDVLHYLRDENRAFSSYELAKIKSIYKGVTEVERLVETRKESEELAFTLDPEYTKLNEMTSILMATRHAGLRLVYLPADNLKGYEVLNLSLDIIDKHPDDIMAERSRVADLLASVPNEKKEDWELLRKATSLNNLPSLVYPEFDQRIFRSSPTFDIVHRFKYLEERFNDKSTDRWDFTRDDYDPMAHLRFLEAQHDLKLKNDPAYAARYREAERKAREASDDDRRETDA